MTPSALETTNVKCVVAVLSMGFRGSSSMVMRELQGSAIRKSRLHVDNMAPNAGITGTSDCSGHLR